MAANAFRKELRLNRLAAWSHEQLCKGWAMEEMSEIKAFCREMIKAGFRQVRAEEISMKVAPSVLHVPGNIVRMLLAQLFRPKRKMNPTRWRNLYTCLLSIVIGLQRQSFGYFIVSGRK